MSSVSSTGNSGSTANAANVASTITAPGGALNENAFLQLLVTQMQYQDPLQPQDNSQMIAQLAQFTSLQEMTNVSTSNQSILQQITYLTTMTQVQFAHQLLGTQVTVNDANGTPVSGDVTSVQFANGEPQLVVNGTQYPMSAMVEMGAGTSAG